MLRLRPEKNPPKSTNQVLRTDHTQLLLLHYRRILWSVSESVGSRSLKIVFGFLFVEEGVSVLVLDKAVPQSLPTRVQSDRRLNLRLT